MKISTVQLKKLLVKSVKAVGNNKLLPLTNFISVDVFNGKLRLTTTNMNDYLTVFTEVDSDEEFHVTVNADLFTKLIQKITTETVELKLTDTSLTVVGNGTYKIELPCDENGENIKLANPAYNVEYNWENTEITVANVATFNSSLRPALLVNSNSYSPYMHYYLGDSYVIATDSHLVNEYQVGIVKTPMLLTMTTFDILAGVITDTATLYNDTNSNVAIIDSFDFVLLTHKQNGIEDYKSTAIHNLIATNYDSSCCIRKSELLAVLDRISLFVSEYDKKSITLTFSNNGLLIESTSVSGSEFIDYTECENHKDYKCMIDIELLTRQIKAHSSDVVNIQYGDNRSLKLTDGNLTQLIALMI